MTTTSRLTEQAALRYADMTDDVEEAQNHVLAIQRRVSETERQMRNKDPETQADDIAAYQSELDRQLSRLSAAQDTFLDLSRNHTAIRSWLLQLGTSVELEDVDVEYADVRAGEDHNEAVLRVRADIRDLVAQRSAVERSVQPIEDLFAQADAHVVALAERGRPSMRLDGGRLVFAHVVVGTHADQVAAKLAWLLPEQMKDRLRADIEAQRERETRDGLLVMSVRERSERLREVEERIIAKEREEEYVIRDAEVQGTIIPRRERASPLAVLGLRIAPRARARAA